MIEVARIEGKIFKTMKEAEAHGLELGAGVGGQPYEIVFFFLDAAVVTLAVLALGLATPHEGVCVGLRVILLF